MSSSVRLDDKYVLDEGRVFITGTQAITRILISQQRHDARAGLRTAGFVSGYRGSPLGGVDSALWNAQSHLRPANIVFEPGINEELAATAVYGSQQLSSIAGARFDGVFAAWYGKGPGVDRAGDALKHGNLAGTSPKGGVLVFAGDDHLAKSSTTAHQSEHALMGALMPIIYPSNVEEMLAFGSFGYALSRYAGLWVGFKCVNETADSSMSASLPMPPGFILPEDVAMPAEGLNIIPGETQIPQERRHVEFRLPAAQAFARANGIDRLVFPTAKAELCIVTAGKAYLDVREALTMMGIDEARAEKLGIRLLKLGLIWPADPKILAAAGRDCREVLVVEEKRAFVEMQLKEALYNLPASERPMVSGKRHPGEGDLLPATGGLTPVLVFEALAARLNALGIGDDNLRATISRIREKLAATSITGLASTARAPFFCSGCPHNTSTVVPSGSVGLSGIGCHVMATFMPHRHHLWPVQMGGEGANWVGMSPFTETAHVFQNLGDGTYYHSGLLAIRQAIAAKVNITYKILYNDAVAMTGGQPVEGSLTSLQMAQELLAEGVKEVHIVADDLERYAQVDLGSIPLSHRDDLDSLQIALRARPGVTAIIYDQVCAAEKRRRRKKGTVPLASEHAFINPLVCEGCGDCGARSNCVSIMPVETEFGRKRTIDQSSCNNDMSCVKGFCPSFVTVEGELKKREPRSERIEIPDLPFPEVASGERVHSTIITGIGGSGVITIGAILAMAAHIEGKAASVMDSTGVSQKNGAVFSHLRIASRTDEKFSARIVKGGADLLLACDMVAATSNEAADCIAPGDSIGVLNSDVVPTADFTYDPNSDAAASQIAQLLGERLDPTSTLFVEATGIVRALTGDTIGTNMFMVGVALQRGLLPVGLAAVRQAIELNSVAVPANLEALDLGRWAAVDLPALQRLASLHGSPQAKAEPLDLDTLIQHREEFLVDYQNEAYAARYREFVDAVLVSDRTVGPELRLTASVARNLFKLMAYKDEYEVARLHTSGDFLEEVAARFHGKPKIHFHLAPPIMNTRNATTGLPEKRAFGSWMQWVFKGLAKARGLRGTPFDPFGYTEERQMERQLIEEYRQTIGEVLTQLSSANYALAVELAELPETIRGYGHIKKKAVTAAEARKRTILAKFRGKPIARSGRTEQSSSVHSETAV